MSDPLIAFYKAHPHVAEAVPRSHVRDPGDRDACVDCSTRMRRVRYPCAPAWHAAEAVGRPFERDT